MKAVTVVYRKLLPERPSKLLSAQFAPGKPIRNPTIKSISTELHNKNCNQFYIAAKKNSHVQQRNTSQIPRLSTKKKLISFQKERGFLRSRPESLRRICPNSQFIILIVETGVVLTSKTPPTRRHPQICK